MKKGKDERSGNGWRLLLVQSISCAVLILALLLLRLAGGGIFQQMKEYFEQAMEKNALAAAIHALWEDETAYTAADGGETAPTVPPAGDA